MSAKNLILRATAVAAALLTLSSCLNKEKELAPLSQPMQLAYEATTSEIVLTWASVQDAGQYYYRLENENHLVVTKGTVSTTSVTISGLKPDAVYTAFVKAVPSVESYKVSGVSEYASLEVRTEAPIVRQYEWVFDNAEVYFGDGKNFYSTKARFGLEKETGYYVVEAYCGVSGFDLEFTTDEKGFVHPTRTSSIFMKEDAGWDGAVYLAHGLGGTAQEYVVFFDNYKDGYNNFTGNETGGIAYYWCMDPNNEWTYWQVTYGNYTPPEPEPDPIQGDAAESWEKTATAAFNGEPLGTAQVSFNAETGVYTVDGWFGVEGYGLSFTRNAETGLWVLDPENSSACISGPDADGYMDMAHGLVGKDWYTTCLYNISGEGSGLALGSDERNGTLFATVLNPARVSGQYTLTWESGPELDGFSLPGVITLAGVEVGTAQVTYDPETKLFTIDKWFGVEGKNIVFSIKNDIWRLDFDLTNSDMSEPDMTNNGATAMDSGIEGAATVWYYTEDSRSGMEGDAHAGSVWCEMWDINGAWSQYRVTWKESAWSVVGDAWHDGDKMGQATLSYDPDTRNYTISSWLGVEGYDLVFKIENGGWVLDYVNSSACISKDGPDGNGALGLQHGVADATSSTCWYYPADTRSWFTGGPEGGSTGFEMWGIWSGTWSKYTFSWPAE
ncbi:MAG: fibronectin type III domain-containing protein [Bacteroidales bacterium]|nr:fibronectin type III domain-containing protein [Bacteroidales bacterium]